MPSGTSYTGRPTRLGIFGLVVDACVFLTSERVLVRPALCRHAYAVEMLQMLAQLARSSTTTVASALVLGLNVVVVPHDFTASSAIRSRHRL